VVDDNATNRRVLSRQIAPHGVRDACAGDGPEALLMLREAKEGGDPFDAAVIDMQMPGMDGLQLARAVKGEPAIADVRLILLTSMGKRGDDAEGVRRVGIEAYLTKPARQHELRDALATVVGRDADGAADGRGDTQLVTCNVLREARAQSRGRVLVAEDNPVNQMVALKMLERLGYRVDVVKNGAEALEEASLGHYDAVLMDVQMPEMDGYEATAKIREREGAEKHTPVIAMTANALAGEHEEALSAGMDDYVAKPVKAEELDRVLRLWTTPADRTAGTEAAEGPDAPDVAPPLDPTVLETLRSLQDEGEPDLVAELAGMFLDDAARRLEDLRDAIGEEDGGKVRGVSHALKGSSGNMGATRVHEVCAELEGAGESGNLAATPRLLERLEEELALARPALERRWPGAPSHSPGLRGSSGDKWPPGRCPATGAPRYSASGHQTRREGQGLAARTGMISDANDTTGRVPEIPERVNREEEVWSWLAAIVQSSNDAIMGMTLDGTITSCNPAAERLYGYTAVEAVGQPISLMLPPDLPDEVPALLARVKHGEFVAGYETKKLAKDGRLIDVALTMSPIRGPGGDLIGASTVARDETERKRTDEALRRNNTLVELLQGAAIASNEASSFEEAMRTCLALMRDQLGIPLGRVYLVTEGAEEAVSTDICYSSDPEKFDAFVRATDSIRFAPGVGLPGMVLADGEPAWVEDVREDPGFLGAEAARRCGVAAGFAVPVLVRREVVAVLEFFMTEAAEPDRWLLGMLRQVGTQLGRVVERQRAEREHNRLNRELEMRNLELNHKNSEVEAFVYSVSHDLRSPLVNLEGFSQELALVCGEIREILADGDLPPEVRRRGLALVDEDMATSTHFIREAVKRLSGIIDALLRLSRVGRLEYRRRRVDLNPIVERVVDAMGGTLAERGGTVVVDDLPPAWGDPTALEQVFANLIGNAVLYLDPGRPGLIEVGCKEDESGEGDAPDPEFRNYYVRDNGIGIPGEATEKIFQVFQRLRPKHADGEGMGLALVQRIVERHDGEVWVESSEGEGSTFFVRLRAKGEGRE